MNSVFSHVFLPYIEWALDPACNHHFHCSALSQRQDVWGAGGGGPDTRRVFQRPLHLVLILISGAFPVSNTDVMVWVQASSQGQHPAIHLQPSNTMVLDGTTQGWSSMAHTFSVKRTLTHQSGWVFNHCNCSILYMCLNIVYKT